MTGTPPSTPPSTRPRIAVTACAAHKQADYLDAVRAGGGDPFVVDFRGGLEALAGADGVLLTGGVDVDPGRYGQMAHPATNPPEPERDAFELAVCDAVSTRGLPALAICRGLQVLNVARGGTLVQDVPSLRPGGVTHEDDATPQTLAHPLTVEPDTLLARVLSAARADEWALVNSRHHQAIDRLGTGLLVAATAPDGIVEAVEDPAHAFLLAVQFHPENFWRTGQFRCLFAALTRAAAGRRDGAIGPGASRRRTSHGPGRGSAVSSGRTGDSGLGPAT